MNLPEFDQTYTALLEDLEARGLLDETLVVVMSEMGRTPRINGNGGRDHWTFCYSTFLAGGGIRGGTLYGESDAQAAYVRDRPVSTSDVLDEKNFMSILEAKHTIESRFGVLMPEPEFRTNGPATYYQISGRQQRLGFIGAMTNLHFCESCNKLRLTCDGKLRPCLGSYLEFDIMMPLRAGASDAELRQFFLDVVDRKPEQHDFRTNYQPNRKMIAIGG